MNTIENLKKELSQKLFETMRNTTHGKNLYKGIEVACYPLSDDALTGNETMTVYNYEQLKALQDLVSLQGEYDVEVQYLDSEYCLWGEALYNISYFIELATKFPEIPVEVISYLLNELPDDCEDILTSWANEEEEIDYIIVNATDELQAFYEWLDVYDEIDIPSHLQTYFDYEKYMTDRVKHGTLNIKEIGFNKYLIIDTKQY